MPENPDAALPDGCRRCDTSGAFSFRIGRLTRSVDARMRLLPDADAFRQLADGSRTGLAADGARLLLAALSLPYGAAVRLRNAAYDVGLLPAARAAVPVVSVGNLTLGGTGKTPLVAWIARRYRERGCRVAIVSRGYGARRGERSDEAAELALVLPDVPHVADRDRVAAVERARRDGSQVVVLDDGFQHRRLARRLDIVVVDATDPFGCGHLFPRGLLREPLASLRRADAVVLTRATAISRERRAAIRTALAAAAGQLPEVWIDAGHQPVALAGHDGRRLPLEWLAGHRPAAFAGIGNPAAFRDTLTRLGSAPVAFRAFPDHHPYSDADVRGLADWSAAAGATALVTTLKDLVKLPDAPLPLPLVALEIALEPLGDAGALERLLDTVWAASGTPR